MHTYAPLADKLKEIKMNPPSGFSEVKVRASIAEEWKARGLVHCQKTELTNIMKRKCLPIFYFLPYVNSHTM